jgi:hypothetical protein
MAEHSVLSSLASRARRLRPTSRTRFAGWGLYDETIIDEREKSLPSPSGRSIWSRARAASAASIAKRVEDIATGGFDGARR